MNEERNDSSDAERKGNEFKRIQQLQTAEYLEIAGDLAEILPDPDQYLKAMKYLRNGLATTAEEARELAQKKSKPLHYTDI